MNAETTSRPVAKFKTLAEFVSEFEPLSYAIEPVIRSSSVYALTARTGAGKTGFMVTSALSVAAGRKDLLNRDIMPGRVAYLAFENPDDVRMRLMVAAYRFGIDQHELLDRLVILDKRMRPEEVTVMLQAMAEVEPFRLIFLDTLIAAFDGDNINDAVQARQFMTRLRPMTQIKGLPSLVVAAHPTKNASEDQLVPHGSGDILNEVDGNLCLARKADTGESTLHWQGKLRGIEFEPLHFRTDISSCPDVVDAKGRQVMLPTMLPCTETDVEERQEATITTRRKVLAAIIDDPEGSIAAWAAAVGHGKSLVAKHLNNLAKEGLTENILGKWRATAKGKQAFTPR